MSLIAQYLHFARRKGTVKPPDPDPEPVQLAAPTGFTAVAEGEEAVLNWTPNPSGGNQVLEKEEGGTRGLLAEISSGATSYRRVQGYSTACTYYLKCKGDNITTLDSPYTMKALMIGAAPQVTDTYTEEDYLETDYSD